MKAVILVGGQGTRLRPLTINTPKAMVPVLNKPFLEHVIGHLSGHNIRDIILAQGHLAQPIEGYLGDGRRLGVRLSYIVEDAPLGTAGAVKNTQKHLDDSFLVLNGDVFTDLDISAMARLHRQRKATATIALTPVADPTSYGLIETNAQGRVTRFLEKPGWEQVTTNMINAGTYVLEPEVLAHIPEQAEFSFERQVFPMLLDRGEPIYAYPSTAYWIDIGNPEKYLQLNRDLLYGKSSRYRLAQGKEVSIGENSQIQPTARITGPALIGENCYIGRKVTIKGPAVIGPGCQIQDGAIIEQSIIWPAGQIGAGTKVTGSIIADHCRLGADSIIEESVLGDNVTVATGYRLKPGSQIWPGTRLPEQGKKA